MTKPPAPTPTTATDFPTPKLSTPNAPLISNPSHPSATDLFTDAGRLQHDAQWRRHLAGGLRLVGRDADAVQLPGAHVEGIAPVEELQVVLQQDEAPLHPL